MAQIEPLHNKITKWLVWPGKNQISLGTHTVWTESSQLAWSSNGSLVTHINHMAKTDHSGWIPRQIWGWSESFLGSQVIWLVLSYSSSYCFTDCPAYIRSKISSFLKTVHIIWIVCKFMDLQQVFRFKDTPWSLCCINIQSHMKNMLCLLILVVEKHTDSCKFIWMSNVLQKVEDTQMILQLFKCIFATNICEQNMFPTCDFM